MLQRLRYAVFFLAVLFGACLSDGPSKTPIRLDRGTGLVDTGGIPVLPPPVLDTASIPGQTCENKVPVVGTAQPGTSVFSSGGAGSAIATASPGNGRFCLEVVLNPNQANTIEVRSQNGKDVSPPASVTIQHFFQAGCGEPTHSDAGTGSKEPQNVGLWAQVDAIQKPESGIEASLTDGTTSTVVVWRGMDWVGGWDGWVKIALERPAEITKVVVRWRDNSASAEKQYGSEYRLLFSDATDPVPPTLNDAAWKQIKVVTGGNGGDDEFVFTEGSEPTARHVALWLEADGETNFDEWFAIAEVEIWALPAGSTGPPPPKPSVCSGKF